jgi:formamidopyrimidine-DNA glycosylase
MPELPEVETIKRSLQSITKTRIKDLKVNRYDIIRQKDYEPEDLYGQYIADVSRRGKYLIISTGNDLNLVFHMGMSGRLYISKDISIMENHVHIIINLDNKENLIFQDPRRFGGIWLVQNIDSFFGTLGKEPLGKDFTNDYLFKITRNRKTAIKNLILKQELVCGIGNIYADEALFEAGIRPERPANSLSMDEIQNLRSAIRSVLKKSVNKRGTTFRDYRDGYNQVGSFQNYLQVYGRVNQICPRCGETIKKTKVGGRSSHYCENCQN